MQQLIYLDNNATTQVDPRVLEAMMPFLTNQYGNPSSPHQFGLNTANAIKLARKQTADLIGALSHEIVFTSGATEAINLALKGVAQSLSNKGKHIITVKTEHSATLDSCNYLDPDSTPIEEGPTRSVSQLGYDALLHHLSQLVLLVASVPSYTPNEPDLQSSVLTTLLANLQLANSTVITADAALGTARAQRNIVFYGTLTGLVDVARQAKKYVKSAFGGSSPQYKRISGIPIR